MISIFPDSLIRFAKNSPHPIYAVGGFLRNLYAGLDINATDIDLCGEARVEELGVPYRLQSKKLGTALVTIGERQYEYTPFRSETYFGGKHTPETVQLGVNLQTDAQRRDFTVGCIYCRLADGEIFDPYGGVADAKNKIIRQIHDKVFLSDGLRLLRMVRIAAETGFDIDENTKNCAKSQAHLLADISPERKRQELVRMLNADLMYGVTDAHFYALVYAESAGLFEYFIPEMVQMRKFPQNPLYHNYDVLWHTFHTVKNAHPRVRLAALFHDIAKPKCKLRDGNMHKHAMESARMAKEIMERLRFSNKEIDFAVRLIYNHMYDLKGQASFNKVKIFVADNMDIIDDLMLLNRADALGTGKHNDDLHKFDKVKQAILDENAPYDLSLLKISGDDLIEIGFSGQDVGLELGRLRRICILDPVLNRREWLVSTAQNDLRIWSKICQEERSV